MPTPATIYLAANYVAQPIILLAQVMLSLFILIYASVLWLTRWLRQAIGRNNLRRRSGLTMSISVLYVHWFFFGAFLLLIVPTDIVTDIALRKSLVGFGEIKKYQAYWFEILPAVVLIGLLFLSGIHMLAFWTIRRGRARRAFHSRQKSDVGVSEHGNYPEWMPDRTSAQLDTGTLVGPRFLAPLILSAGVLLLAIAIHLGTARIFGIIQWKTSLPEFLPLNWFLVVLGIFFLL